jgi:hypothetical protein
MMSFWPSFSRHAKAWNRTPTPFVSVSDRIVDTVQRAFQKSKFGESPADIGVLFIEVPLDKHQNQSLA